MSNCIAGTYHITCDQGATFKRTITWTNSARQPINLTGYTARMHVRSTVDSSAIVISLTTENNRISLGGITGAINLTIDATTSATLAPALCVYDLELVSAGGEVTRLVEGNFKIKAEVTR